MGQESLDTHQLAGLDDRERGFSRLVSFERAGDQYRALLRYETVRVTTDPRPTQEMALLTLIQTLHAHGYRQLRTQVTFRNGVYLGSQEMWIDHPDPPLPQPASTGFMARFWTWVRPRQTNE